MKVVPIVSKSILTQMTWAIQIANERLEDKMEGVTARQISVLQAVAANAGCKQNQLVAASGIDRSTMAELVRRLVSRGLLARKRTREDARAYSVTITAAGQRVLQSAASPVADVDTWLLDGLSAADKAAVKRWLGAIIERPLRHAKPVRRAA